VLFSYEVPLLEVYNTCRGFVKMSDDCIKDYEDICNSVLKLNIGSYLMFVGPCIIVITEDEKPT